MRFSVLHRARRDSLPPTTACSMSMRILSRKDVGHLKMILQQQGMQSLNRFPMPSPRSRSPSCGASGSTNSGGPKTLQSMPVGWLRQSTPSLPAQRG